MSSSNILFESFINTVETLIINDNIFSKVIDMQIQQVLCLGDLWLHL